MAKTLKGTDTINEVEVRDHRLTTPSEPPLGDASGVMRSPVRAARPSRLPEDDIDAIVREGLDAEPVTAEHHLPPADLLGQHDDEPTQTEAVTGERQTRPEKAKTQQAQRGSEPRSPAAAQARVSVPPAPSRSALSVLSASRATAYPLVLPDAAQDMRETASPAAPLVEAHNFAGAAPSVVETEAVAPSLAPATSDGVASDLEPDGPALGPVMGRTPRRARWVAAAFAVAVGSALLWRAAGGGEQVTDAAPVDAEALYGATLAEARGWGASLATTRIAAARHQAPPAPASDETQSARAAAAKLGLVRRQAKVAWAKHRHRRAASLGAEWASLAPRDASAAHFAARASLRADQPAAALRWAEHAVSLRPRQGAYLETLGDAHRRLGDHAEAKEAYERAARRGIRSARRKLAALKRAQR